jgi:hypothetical protein
MGEVHTFTEEHATGVASLYFRAVRGRNPPAGQALPKYFTELHTRNPWASPDMPALLYLDKGKVVGAVGVLPRQMEFRGRPIRIVTTTLFMVDPAYRHEPTAIQLLARVLKGPQELSWTDGASGSVKAFWTALGGHSASLYALNWIRILRPFGTGSLGLERLGGAAASLKAFSRLFTGPLDLALSKMPLAPLREPATAYSFRFVGAGELLECIQQVGWREPLRPLYTRETFPWLIREAAKARYGELRTVVVSNPKGVPCGWFVYYAAKGGASFVLQLGVGRPDDFKETLRALFRDAWEQGSACVKGASIPQFLRVMTEEHCFFRHPDDRVLIHSRNPEIANAIRMGEAAITRLDGIGWLRFSREQWDQ